jgi:DNA primase
MDNILDELYEKLTDAHNYGHYLSAICPFHDDARPSLMVYPDYYRCLSCGATGKTQKLLDKLSNTISIPKTKPDFRNPWSRWLNTMSLSDILKQSWKTLKSQPSLGNYMYLRGINPTICAKLGIGYREDWFTIPIRDEHKIVGAVARANAETNHAKAKYIFP